MLLSEEEAKTKWCPLVREDFLSGPPFNGKPTCIGSACMAWRWGEAERKWESETVFAVDGKEGPAPDGEGWKRGSRTRAASGHESTFYSREIDLGANRRGYCGLAGKVEP